MLRKFGVSCSFIKKKKRNFYSQKNKILILIKKYFKIANMFQLFSSAGMDKVKWDFSNRPVVKTDKVTFCELKLHS